MNTENIKDGNPPSHITVGSTVFGPVTWGDGKTTGKVVPSEDRINADFIRAFNDIQNAVHETAVDRGWWNGRDNSEQAGQIVSDDLRKFIKNTDDSSAIALMHSELSEALEALRHGNPPDDKVPQFTGAEAELADCIIRIMDLAQARGWRVAEALVAKAEMNKSRPKMHGKGF